MIAGNESPGGVGVGGGEDGTKERGVRLSIGFLFDVNDERTVAREVNRIFGDQGFAVEADSDGNHRAPLLTLYGSGKGFTI